MNDRIANSLKQHVPADIGLRLGLTGSQMDTCFALASRVTAEVVQGSVLKEPEAVRSLLSKEANTPEASKVARRIGEGVTNGLTRELGMNALNASAMKDALLPALTTTLQELTQGKPETVKDLFSHN